MNLNALNNENNDNLIETPEEAQARENKQMRETLDLQTKVIFEMDSRLKDLEAAAAISSRRSALFAAYIITETGIQMPTRDRLVLDGALSDTVEQLEFVPIDAEDDSDAYYEFVDGEEPTVEQMLSGITKAVINYIESGDAEEVLRLMMNPHFAKHLTPTLRAQVQGYLKNGVN